VLCHRLLLDPQSQFSGVTIADVIGQLLSSVPPPLDRAPRD
jgi:MoxR-like ATPase